MKAHPRSCQTLSDLSKELRRLAAERDWDQFHSPRNLAAALSVEAAEVLEHFLWLTDEHSQSGPDEKTDQIALEFADVLLYTVRLADRLGIDLSAAAERKIEINSKKYPTHLAYGTNRKYTEL